jgi:DME family drug/metabolite transporter
MAGALAYALDRERLTGRWAACTALATTGVLLLVLAGSDAEVSPGGIGLALTAGASYALYTVASKRLLSLGHGPEEVMARGFGAAAIVLLPVLIAGSPGWLGHADGIALVLYLGAVPTALAYVLFARGLRHLTAGETSTLTLAEPLTAAALGAIVLGERPGALAVLGAALVLTGLVAIAAPTTRRAEPAPA